VKVEGEGGGGGAGRERETEKKEKKRGEFSPRSSRASLLNIALIYLKFLYARRKREEE
jgi:hypothetical protein